MNRLTKIKITELNPHVICVLCGGYYINATTIVECLHSFCRTCITRYLETSKYCPVCDVMVHKTRPLEYIRSDKTLQDLVYKLVPGLYKSEMKRRREYYAEHDNTGVPQPPSEDRGTEFHDRIIYTEDEKISLSLELCAEGIPFKTPSTVHGHNGPENIKISDVRYLSCPAAFSVGNLKKFIRMKFDLKLKYEIDVFHTAEPLPDYYTLMDIAYIFTWTRRAPLRLYYTVFECKIPRKIPEPTIMEQNKTIEQEKVSMVEKQEQDNRVKSKNERNRKENKKRKLLDGPDDITPDFGDEKLKGIQEKRKEGGAQRKRAKKSAAAVVDSSVMEAMSESEEQLAKLTLNSSGDVRALCIDTGDESSMQSDCTETETQSVIANSNLCNGLQDSINENDKDNVNKPKSQISPNSISLSLFQPLNATETKSDHTNSNRDTVFDFVHETSENKSSAPTKVRGKPGRKKLNKDTKKVNGAKVDKTDLENKHVISGDGLEVSEAQQKKKPGRKKKSESVVNGSSENEAKPKVKKPVKINGETGERVKRKYVRKADKQKQLETDEDKTKLSETDKTKQSETVSKQTPKKGKKAQKEDTKTSSKESCESTAHVNNETRSNANDLHENNALQVKQSANNEHDGNKSNNVNKTSISSITEPKGAICDNKIVSVPDQTLSTPLYGQTPKVTESNQGLPVAPSPPCAENSVSVLNRNSSCEPLFNTRSDASTKESSTVSRITVQQNGISDNGALSGTLKHVNKGDYPTDMTNNSDDMDGKLVIDEGQCMDNGFHINGLEPGSDHFTNIEIPQLCPPQDMRHLGLGFNPTSPCPTTNSINNGYSPMDQVSDQPLDLTSSVRRDEYMKGKIFKTKMLKRTYMKQDMGLSQKDQKLGSPAKNGFHPHSWT